MLNIGMPELILVLVIALVIFGPGKLPEVGKALGRSIQEFKSAAGDGGRTDENKLNAAKNEEEQKKADDKPGAK